MSERWRCDWCGGEWDEDENDPLPPSKDILAQCPVSGCYWCGDECCGAYCYPVATSVEAA